MAHLLPLSDLLMVCMRGWSNTAIELQLRGSLVGPLRHRAALDVAKRRLQHPEAIALTRAVKRYVQVVL